MSLYRCMVRLLRRLFRCRPTTPAAWVKIHEGEYLIPDPRCGHLQRRAVDGHQRYGRTTCFPAAPIAAFQHR